MENVSTTDLITQKLRNGENEDRSFENKGKRMKKAYAICGLSPERLICELLEFQKEKRVKRKQKAYLKK